MATARLKSDPTRDLRGALTAPTITHYGAVLEPARVGELLRAIDAYQGQPIAKLAMQLAPHVFVPTRRTATRGVVRYRSGICALDDPGEQDKDAQGSSRSTVTAIDNIVATGAAINGSGRICFPRRSGRALVPMSDNTINAGLRRLGYASDEMTAHGFRAMASTLLNESGKWNPDAIERALAHGDSDKVRAAYHRGAHWNERVAMAQWWSDYLDQLREGELSPQAKAS